jgi:AbrB family looped-hinge helix DNA binding protein
MVTLIKIDPQGHISIPVWLRKKWGLEEGNYVNLEENDQGILIRPATSDQMKKVRINMPDILTDLQNDARDKEITDISMDEIIQIVSDVRRQYGKQKDS